MELFASLSFCRPPHNLRNLTRVLSHVHFPFFHEIYRTLCHWISSWCLSESMHDYTGSPRARIEFVCSRDVRLFSLDVGFSFRGTFLPYGAHFRCVLTISSRRTFFRFGVTVSSILVRQPAVPTAAGCGLPRPAPALPLAREPCEQFEISFPLLPISIDRCFSIVQTHVSQNVFLPCEQYTYSYQ